MITVTNSPPSAFPPMITLRLYFSHPLYCVTVNNCTRLQVTVEKLEVK